MARQIRRADYWLVAFLIVVLWLAVSVALYIWKGKDAGAIGDIFGAVNALFSGLAFGGLIFAILLQREELELQRNELRDTRREFETQNKTLATQLFENTFFQLLRSHHDIVRALEMGSGDNRAAGRVCFDRLFNDMDRIYKNWQSVQSPPPQAQYAWGPYETMYGSHEWLLGHYFRQLYHIIKFVNDSQIEDKRRYCKFVRAQLSSFELSLLFYNCLSSYGRDNFKPLVEQYALLQNMNHERVLDKAHRRLYEKSAFGE